MQMRDHLSLLAGAVLLFYTTQMKDCFCHNLHTFLPLRPGALKWNSFSASSFFLICFTLNFFMKFITNLSKANRGGE